MLTIVSTMSFGTGLTTIIDPQSETRFLGPEMNHSSINQ